MNKFEFSGVVSDISFVDTEKGRITKIIVENHDGRHPVPVLVDFFEELSKSVEAGSDVVVSGKLNGRIWNDKVFNGLRAENIMVAVQEGDPDFKRDDDLPF